MEEGVPLDVVELEADGGGSSLERGGHDFVLFEFSPGTSAEFLFSFCRFFSKSLLRNDATFVPRNLTEAFSICLFWAYAQFCTCIENM